jgi:hypothetical protein
MSTGILAKMLVLRFPALAEVNVNWEEVIRYILKRS